MKIKRLTTRCTLIGPMNNQVETTCTVNFFTFLIHVTTCSPPSAENDNPYQKSSTITSFMIHCSNQFFYSLKNQMNGTRYTSY